ncbi:MAG: hypothetical protein IKR47_03795 [Lachnospiraceae bacterium]|nr:hypothetical protein [Lachnospiraceae bacterium]
MNIKPSEVLTMGILACALCGTGIMGIIFGTIGKKKVRQYLAENNGMTCGQVTAGSITSKVGFILGIVMTCFWVIYIAVIVGAIAFAIAQ